MSRYPEATGQGLYQPSSTQVHGLGTEAQFTDSDGNPVWARYMKNNNGTSSVAAGLVVAYGPSLGEFGSAYASTAHPSGLAGGLAASCVSGGYAWVIFRGRQTNASMNSSHASAAGMFFLRPGAAGGLISELSSAAWPAWATTDQNICAFAESATSNTTGATGNVVWVWR